MVESLKPNRDVVVTNSEFTRRDFCAFTGFPEERTIAAPLAASSHFHPVTGARAMEELRERLGIGMRPYFLNVANPQPRKNMPHLVSSFYRFLAACPEWQGVLVLAGDSRSGWDTGALEEAIHSVPQFTDRVLRVGGVPEHDLPTLYSCALAFVFPSSYEGFGLPVLEAMACGAPVICADVTSLPEVAGDAALLVSPEDNSALSQAMQCLAKSESRRSELREKGFRQAGRFTWSGTAERVVEAYRLAHLQMSVPQGGACHLEALSV
jgi:glycosyltransferase involved in cell wall biosynthesis